MPAWAAAANRGDAAAVAAMYNRKTNATMLPPGMDLQKGRAAIEKKNRGRARRRVPASGNFTLTTIDVSQVGPQHRAGKSDGSASTHRPPKKKRVMVNGKYVRRLEAGSAANGCWTSIFGTPTSSRDHRFRRSGPTSDHATFGRGASAYGNNCSPVFPASSTKIAPDRAISFGPLPRIFLLAVPPAGSATSDCRFVV